MRKRQVKTETSLDKIQDRKVLGRSKSTESPARGRAKDAGDVTLVPLKSKFSGGQQRSGIHTRRKVSKELTVPSRPFVPVVDRNQKPLMPTKASRAESWIKSGKATPFWKGGIFCVRLNVEPSARNFQKTALGIDPGSKREAFAVKSRSHTYLNVLTEAIYWVKDAMERRMNARRNRRNRNTPCRQPRSNRACLKNKGLPPSTMARWQWKLRIVDWLLKMFPITVFVVEDISAKTIKGQRKWNRSFSPLEVGKTWFYHELMNRGQVETLDGYETFIWREMLGLKKSASKLDDKFECHNVDSWILARDMVGGSQEPDNINVVKIVPLRWHRRQLHMFQPAKRGARRIYGGTRSLGFKRGSLVKHKKYGTCFVGGASNKRITLHSLENGETISRKIRTSDIKFLGYISFRRTQRIVHCL